MNLREYLQTLEEAKGNRRAALNNYNAARTEYDEAFRPIGGRPDKDALNNMYMLCSTMDGYPTSDFFICLALLFYNPEALFDGKIKIKLAKQISEVLGVTHSMVYISRKKITVWLSLYPDFFSKVSALYAKLITV